MLTVAYLANRFPAAVEPYVGDEIRELRQRGIQVIATSVRVPEPTPDLSLAEQPDLCLQPLRWILLVRASILITREWKQILCLLTRVLFKGRENIKTKIKALLHTWLGAYYAALLRDRGVHHIHVHHGYFGAWIAMVAARLLKISFSMTLHGSDLLLHGVYLDTKLDSCRFCVTISEYNREYILQTFRVAPRKIILSRLGVDVPLDLFTKNTTVRTQPVLILLAAGRLHAVKNHAFLIHACARLRDLGLDFECRIAGQGPEREHLKLLVRGNRLHDRVKLLGHIARDQMQSLYRSADLFVLTSLSEGIPLVLMEAMANGILVLAPSITGIPELVIAGESGFLYKAGDLEDFVGKVLHIEAMLRSTDNGSLEKLSRIRQSAHLHILHYFNHSTNLNHFADNFLNSIAIPDWSPPHENPVLQQI